MKTRHPDLNRNVPANECSTGPDRIDCTLSIPPDIIETSELVIEHLFFIRYFNWIIQAQFFFDEQPVANIRVQQKHIVIIRAQVCVLKESR